MAAKIRRVVVSCADCGIERTIEIGDPLATAKALEILSFHSHGGIVMVPKATAR